MIDYTETKLRNNISSGRIVNIQRCMRNNETEYSLSQHTATSESTRGYGRGNENEQFGTQGSGFSSVDAYVYN